MVSSKLQPDFPTATLSLDLRPQHVEEFERLRRLLTTGEGFQLIILQFNDPAYRDRVIEKALRLVEPSVVFEIEPDTYPTFHSFEKKLAELAARNLAIHVTGTERWLARDKKKANLTGFNYHREAIAEACPVALLLWMIEPDIKSFAVEAPDMWAWRAAVLRFDVEELVSRPLMQSFTDAIDGMPLQRKIKRINEINEFLADPREDLPGTLHASLLNELGRLYARIGKHSDALPHYQASLKLSREIGDRAGEGTTLNNISQIYDARGDYDTALDYLKQSLGIRREIGDRAGEAVTLHNMGHLHLTKNEQDAAIGCFVGAYLIARQIGYAELLKALDDLAKGLGGSGLEFWEALAQQLQSK